MKKHLLVIATFFLSGIIYGQVNLKSIIRGEKGVSNHYTAVPANQNVRFTAASARTIFGLDANADLILTKTEPDKLGYIHYRYFQTYKGIPVENSMYIAHTRNGLLRGMTGRIIVDFDPEMDKRNTARLSASQAEETAIRSVGAQVYAWKDAGMEQNIKMQTGNKYASYMPKARLVWYSPGFGLDSRALRLAYKIDVYAIKPLSRADYFVDAITGKIIGKEDKIYFTDATGTAGTYWSGTQTIHSDFTGTNYQLRDYTKGNGVITLHGESGSYGTDYSSATANWTLSGFNVAALDAHYGVGQTYAFYMAKFGRNSYDNAGTALYSYVNDPTYIDNAYWDGSAMHFCKRSTNEGGGVTGIDVTGHELTHGVTQATCGLVYSYESGAMNESLSDIMGKSVQFWSKPTDINWQLSNDMNWIIRDISNPNLLGQPDTYKGTYWYTGFGDNGGVHYNSGVGNFMFYLLVNGGTGTNDIGNAYTVGALGLEKADQIIYRSQSVYLVSTSQYIDWRTACVNAASDLYGATSNEVDQVKNAFYAVGLGSSSTGCDYPVGLAASNITKSGATISWSAVSGVSSYNLQWKLSTATTWNTVSNIAATSYNLTGLSPAFAYDVEIESNCSGGTTSGYSSPITFTTLTAGGYCISYGQSTDYEFIQRVAVGTTGYTSGNNGGYGNFVSFSGPVKAGRSYVLQLTPGFVSSIFSENWTVYADFNRDGDYADAGENLGSVISTSAAAVNLPFTVPATATNARTGLRVQMSYSVTQTDPCAIFTYGEVEDYSIRISGGTGLATMTDITQNKGNSLTILPNPLKGTMATVGMELAAQGKVTLKVSDLSGRLLVLQEENNGTKGKNTFILKGTERLNSGVFMVVAEQNGKIVGRAQLLVN
ncbi:T9SS type A sorting domain-containing protein [Panacibacter ginsenosidivorans]|uniref:T9SS type A sorting domain-containing protein n=1 Tax=Panacibacter ginsenosidivorans TaxID=1813871 RepID=A0A5B8VAH7_9BACT|nr:M4 family metallopeptidase [Panacibacter ginsenosidivorans]QEC67871.1 T9SS type A sorting domain-containing protein [Panacibacter ginsenosidivorans]